MKSITLRQYGPGSPYIKPLVLMDSKEGKTTWLFMSLLGLWPWQKNGGVVSHPSHLHFITLDTDALDRIVPKDPPDGRSIMELAGVPMEVINYIVDHVDVIPLNEEMAAIRASQQVCSHTWLNYMKTLRQSLVAKTKDPKETHAVVMSSFTTMCGTHERGLFGPPDKDGYGDQRLWTILKEQLVEVRVLFQSLQAHMHWEGHVGKVAKFGSKNGEVEDTMQVHGGAKMWPANTSHNFRIVRESSKWKGADGKPTNVDGMYINPRPAYSFIPSGGRGVGGLAEKVYDYTEMLMDMGYQVGGWKP